MTLNQRFLDALKRGTGETYLILRHHPGLNVFRDLKRACLNSWSYDQQADGTRAVYLSGLLDMIDRKEAIVEAVIDRLAVESSNTNTATQLIELAGIFAKEGNEMALSTLYDRFESRVWPLVDDAILFEIARIEGAEGIIRIAEIIEASCSDDVHEWSGLAYCVSWVDRHYPEYNIRKRLRHRSRTNAAVRNYLQFELQIKRISHAPSSVTTSNTLSGYEYLRNQILTRKYVVLRQSDIDNLTATDLERFAYDMVEEKEPSILERYLRCFSHVQFPLEPKLLVKIASGPNPRGTRVVEFACRSLAFFRAKDIRKLALERLGKPGRSWYHGDFVYLLRHNYRESDATLLKRLIRNATSEEGVHALVWSLVDLYRYNSTPSCRTPLIEMYRRLTCGRHRYDIVRIMYDNGVLPQAIFEETQFDSYLKLRKWHDDVCPDQHQRA